MKTDNFEEKLIKMTKPEIADLKHQDMLSNAILNAKDKSVLSWWWLSPPLYIIAALMMKTRFNPGTTFFSNLHELTDSNKVISIAGFIILPLIFIILNFLSIRQVNDLAGNPGGLNLFELVWYNIFIICVSILLITIYLL
jgi:hypothetical protein